MTNSTFPISRPLSASEADHWSPFTFQCHATSWLYSHAVWTHAADWLPRLRRLYFHPCPSVCLSV